MDYLSRQVKRALDGILYANEEQMQKYHDLEINSDYQKLKPGQPCGHLGCASHLSHPCEGCGRYAAGMSIRPDVELAMAKLGQLSRKSALLRNYFEVAERNEWSRDEFLVATLLELHKRTEQLQKQLTVAFQMAPSQEFINAVTMAV